VTPTNHRERSDGFFEPTPRANATEREATPAAITVAELVARMKRRVEPEFKNLWVAGEIADFRGASSSGHAYFALKDAAAMVRAKMWASTIARLKFKLENGAAVVVHGSMDLYAPNGGLSLTIDRMIPQGIGEAALAFEQMRKKLAAEGLFAEERKRALPAHPRVIGLVTSRDGAAIRDFLRHLNERFPIRVILAASMVQGAAAPESLASAMYQLSDLAPKLGIEAVALVRGGGGMEDLAAFNSEILARAIVACCVPVVTGVGHEIDTTIADLVADRRAKTPTDAANCLVPEREFLWQSVEDLDTRARRALDNAIARFEDEWASLRDRADLARPAARLERQAAEVANLARRLRSAGEAKLLSGEGRFSVAGARLHGVSPLAILGRGYSLARKVGTDKLLRDSNEVSQGDQIETRLARGSMRSRVEAVDADGVTP
jgi:exodeoxyribonuclease VII large subunit